jgi:hypothetical protein
MEQAKGSGDWWHVSCFWNDTATNAFIECSVMVQEGCLESAAFDQ